MSYPKHLIESMSFEESHYITDGYKWSAQSLVDFAEARKYPVFDLPLCGINLNLMPFGVADASDLLFQIYRVNKTDLKYPIILSDKGEIADGWHRIIKAILRGDETIKAIRLLEMPTGVYIKEN